MEDNNNPIVGRNEDINMVKEAVVFFNGKTLYPFNAHRLYAANSCGLRIFNLSADQQNALSSGDAGSYDGALYDMALVIYLCSQPTSTALRALRLPSECIEKALSWADSIKLLPGSPIFTEASTAFGQLLSSIFENEAIQELSPEDTELSRKNRKKKP